MLGILVYVGTYTNDPAEGIYHLRLDPASGALAAAGTSPGSISSPPRGPCPATST